MSGIKHLFVMAAVITPMALAASSAGAETDEVVLYHQEVVISPATTGDSQALTVSCAGGFHMRRVYESNELVVFSPQAANGSFPVTDSCKYNLRVRPAPDPRLAAATEAGDDALIELLSQQEYEQTRVIQGSFSIVNSEFVMVDSTDTDRE